MGYHFGVLVCAYTAAVVTIVNLAFLIWALSKSGLREDLGTLEDGNCGRIQKSSFWVHLAINVLSTMLLSASNYTMQCLSSPTRKEVDKAHSQGMWLDIGVPSLRNLKKISTYRATLWWLLALSSVPLHLLYNSAIFASLSAREYNLFLVSREFPDGAPFNATNYNTTSAYLSSGSGTPLQRYQNNEVPLSRLDNEDCRRLYSASLITANADVILVTNISNSTDSALGVLHGMSSTLLAGPDAGVRNGSGLFWDCATEQTQAGAKCITPNAAEWSIPWDILDYASGSYRDRVRQMDIQYCLSRPVPENCKLQFSLAIMIVVIICNLFKAVCMGLIAWRQDPEPLVTLGDAISSFLDHPDITTVGNCTFGKSRSIRTKSWDSVPSIWNPKSRRWFQSASKKRWFVCNVLLVIPEC